MAATNSNVIAFPGKFSAHRKNALHWYQTASAELLSELHPNWREVTESPVFREWCGKALTKREQEILNGSWDPFLITGYIDKFQKLSHRRTA